MSVRTEKLVAGLNKAAGVVSGFGARVGKHMGKAGQFLGGAGAEVGKSFAWAGKGLIGPTSKAIDGMVKLTDVGLGMGRALGGLGLRGAIGGFKLLGSAAMKTAGVMREGVNVLGQWGAIGGGIAAAGLYKAAKAASSLAEQSDRARVLFGVKTADVIIDKANLMGEAFGVARSDFIGAASGIGGMMKGMGYEAEQAAQIGAHFAQVATDVASAVQIPVEEAMVRMQSGLAGESEAVRRWGVDLTEANLKVQAAKMGIHKMGGELSQQEKIMVRVAIMDEKLAYAHGNLAKTATGAENATKGFMGRLNNLAETIGTALLPIVGSAMTDLQTGVAALSMAWTDMTAGVVNTQVGVVGAMGETSKSMGWVQKSVGFVADSFQTLKIGFYYAQSYITGAIGVIIKNFTGLAYAIDYAVEKLTGFKSGMGDFLNTYGADLDRLSAKQYETFQAELVKTPAHEGVDAYFAKAQERIKAAQAEAVKPGVDVTKFAPAGMVKAPAAGGPKFASALQAGSQEATSAVLKSLYGAQAGGKAPEEQTAKNTGRMVDLLGKLVGQSALAGANYGGAIGNAVGALAGNF